MRRPGRDDTPDRLYTLTGGRSLPRTDLFDLVTLVVSECAPIQGMQSEHVAILEICRSPTAVVELAAELQLPVGIVMVLLSDLLDTGTITARHPPPRSTDNEVARHALPDITTIERVLVGLRNL